MRTVFLGTSQFAAGVLERLAASPHRPVLAITRPDRPRGRGRRLASPPVAELARTLDVPCSQPQSVNSAEVVAEVERVDAQVLVVCAFGALIREPLLSLREMLNVHPSLLPRWRGAAPIERAIMAGDTETGVCVMRLTEGLDSGPVCLSAAEPIDSQDDYGSLAARLCLRGGELIVAALDAMDAGRPLRFAEQDETQATYAEKIAADDRLLDPGRPAAELERVVRALHPHIGARLARPDGSALGVLRARVAAGVPGAGAAGAAGEPAPGTLAAKDGRLLYGAADGALELIEVQPPGKRPMDARAYLRGHAV